MVVILPGIEISGTIILTCGIGILMLVNIWLMFRLHKKKADEIESLKKFINYKFKGERNEKKGPPKTSA